MGDALRLDSVRFGYRDVSVFRGLELQVAEGETTAILGPNGAGKTTLLRLAAGAIPADAGRILLFGTPLASLSARERARLVAVVPQEAQLAFDFTVREVVLMGRAPHLGLLGLESGKDLEVVREAMERTEVLGFAERPFTRLSGGERQRVVLARALAQQPRLLLLDEPTAFLDLRHRLAVYDLLTRLSRETGLTVVVASHDMNLAARHCGRLVLLHHGEIVADGAPEEVLDRDRLRRVYEVEAEIHREPGEGRPYVVPIAPAR